MFCAQTDTFLEVPLIRWDVSIYYTDNPEGLDAAGKSYTKHAGMFGDVEILGALRQEAFWRLDDA